MTLDEKILKFLDNACEYRSVEEIAAGVGSKNVKGISDRCLRLYWNTKNDMKRIVTFTREGLSEKASGLLYATKLPVDR